MPQITSVIVADNRPNNLPSPEDIAQQCFAFRAKAKAANSSVYIRGCPLVDTSRGDTPYAWVKFGPSLAMSEAKTQQFVHEAIGANINDVWVPAVFLAFQRDRYGFIVMEYVDGVVCDDSDAKLVAAAVRTLISIQGPDAVPGPIGGGLITHRFFADCESFMGYNSVKALERHINGILAFADCEEVLDFGAEAEAERLYLCLSDMNRTNFMKDRWGRIAAIDFGQSCFLPTPFFAFALREGDDFTQLIARHLKYPKSAQLSPLLAAAGILVVFGRNDVGIPRDLRVSRGSRKQR